jgi:hypothetical protein
MNGDAATVMLVTLGIIGVCVVVLTFAEGFSSIVEDFLMRF